VSPNENLGLYAFAEGRFDEAIAQMRLVTDLEPLYPLGHMGLGYSLLYAGHADEALEPLQRGRELNPEFRPHWENMSHAFAALGRAEDAVALWNERIAQYPDDPGSFFPYMEGAYLYRDIAGSLDQATDWFQQALDRSPPRRRAELGVALALLDLDRGDEEAAERRVAAAEEGDPGHRWTRIGRLNLDLYRESYANGAPVARELAAAPLFPPSVFIAQWKTTTAQQHPWEPLGYFGVLAGRPEDSRLLFETTFPELLEGDPPVHAFTLKPAIDLAAVLIRTGEQDHASLLLERAEAYIDRLPAAQRRNQFRTAAMEIYALQGRVDDALDAMQLAIDDGFLSGWWRLDKKPHFELLRDEPRFQEMIRQLREKATGGASRR